jgi:2-polyprenyl-3-methyl-5-hydroxy-6-metoxy-1,4-benzoquinol methylase
MPTSGVERLSFADGTLLGGYSETLDRLAFAAPHCKGRRVLDAGCGTGLGAKYLLDHGAQSVLGIDYSVEAIREARSLQTSAAAEFMVGNLHELATLLKGQARFGAVVSFETLPHLRDPEVFLSAVAQCLDADGAFVVSTPNRAAVALDDAGRPLYGYQHVAYTPESLAAVLHRVFAHVSVLGQWLTPVGNLRKRRAAEQFLYLTESYYQPCARLARCVKRLLGREVLPPPDNHSRADSYPGDYEIAPIQPARVPWAPTSLIAICRN